MWTNYTKKGVRMTTQAHDKVHVEFTTDQMEVLTDTIKSGEIEVGLVAVWEAVLGHPLAEHEGALTPWHYTIPEAQWHELCQAFFDIDEGSIATVSAGLDWMNKGPSSAT